MSQGRPEKTETQKRGEADLKTRLGWSDTKTKGGLGYLCPIPYGQWSKKDNFEPQELTYASNHWKDLEKEGKWPTHLLSFEAWCGMTNYDASPGVKDGGPAFQRLMLMVLGQGSSIKLNDSGAWTGVDKKGLGQMDFTTMWSADRREYGPMFKVDQYKFTSTEREWPPLEWYEGIQLDGDGLGVPMRTDRAANEWVSSGAHLSAHSRPLQQFVATGKRGGVDAGNAQRMGLILGNFSNVGSLAIKGDGKKYTTNANHYGIYTKHDWIVKGMLQTGTTGSGPLSQTLGQSLVSPGVDKAAGQQGNAAGQCWEATRLGDDEPCMLVQNSLAAIYGLYYYPGCNDEKMNWAVEEFVPDAGLNQRFRIRFRVPNPTYGQRNWVRDGGAALVADRDLPVYEPLNPKNREFLNDYLKRAVEDHNDIPANSQEPLKLRPDSKFVGGVFGKEVGNGRSTQIPHFHVPRASRKAPDFGKDDPRTHPTISPWMYLVSNEENQMQVAPFWNQSETWHTLINNRKLDFERGQTLRSAEILAAGPEKQGVAFGFRMSQAFLLYPFQTPVDGNLKRDLTTTSRRVGYMTEPKFAKAPTSSVPAPLAKHVLNWDEWWSDANRTPEQWRAKLLASTDPMLVGQAPQTAPVLPPAPVPPPVTQAGPSTSIAPAPADGSASAAIPTVDVEPDTTDPNLGTGVNDTAQDARPTGSGEAQTDVQTESNQDAAQAASIALNAQDTQNTVATSFGIPGMSLAETLKECDPKYAKEDYTDAEVRRLMGKPTSTAADEAKLSGREKQLLAALKACGLYDPPLDEGAPRRLKGSEAQCHWRTARHSPWSHEQCYAPARIEYETERMDPVKIQAYKDRYGHDANLIQDSAFNIAKIKDVKISWGAKKPVMDTLITAPGRLHRLNLARILVVFFSEEGVGKFTDVQKRAGMRKGLGRPQGSAQNPQDVGVYDARRTASWGPRLWQPVFLNDPETVLSAKLKHCIKKRYLCDRTITNDNELENCLDEVDEMLDEEDQVSWVEQLSRIRSDMKVSEWVTTPWHLEHLPYQRQYAVFRDGECFSEGCKRCSRPFYEYAYHVYADRNAKKGTFGYPQDLWYRGDRGVADLRIAPVPLHDPIFWHPTGKWANAQSGHPSGAAEGGTTQSGTTRAQSQRRTQLKPATVYEQELAEVERLDVQRETDFYTGGTMDWPTYRLYKDRLSGTDKERTHVKSRGDMFFRRYLNLAYSSDLTGDELEDSLQRYYVGVSEGYMFGGQHKVKFGHTDYKVSRSHKYGNVCRDCAGILDKAPGLFIRNNRYQFSGGLVAGNSEAADAATFDYWQHMFGKVVSDSDADVTMDAFLMKGRPNRLSRLTEAERARWNAQFDDAAQTLATSLNARHKFPDGWTRLVEQPTIHVQGSINRQEDRKPDDIKDAIQDLRALFNGTDPSTLNLTNPALKDIVREAERKYMHNEAYARIDYTKQFDSDVKRTEYRNCIIRWSVTGLEWLNKPGGADTLPLDGKKLGKLTAARYRNGPTPSVTFYNCLITDQYDPDLLNQRIRDFKLPTPQEAYRQEVYLATRKGARGRAEHPTRAPTQWKGDGFICEPQGENRPWKLKDDQTDGRAVVQHRAMRQSRLFITYSLHRPISSEGEGRVILERMADALYKLFGEDRWLSEMIVFGKMLKSMDVAGQKGDNVSKALWGVIPATKKQDAMQGFYGSRNKDMPRTSYVYDTYETHIDKLEVDAGCEIGPKMGHPHFHLLLTINHFSYVQFDYFKMNTFLEIMFKGIDTFHGWGKNYYLPGPFYGDNENPYVDIKLYPQDNWKEILAAYVRKNAIPSIVEVESSRRMPGTADARRRAAT